MARAQFCLYIADRDAFEAKVELAGRMLIEQGFDVANPRYPDQKSTSAILQLVLKQFVEREPKFKVGDTAYIADSPYVVTDVAIRPDGKMGYAIEGWHAALFSGEVALTKDEQQALEARVDALMKGDRS